MSVEGTIIKYLSFLIVNVEIQYCYLFSNNAFKRRICFKKSRVSKILF